MRHGALNLRVCFTAASLTHFGGVYLLHQFLQKLKLRSMLCRRILFQQRNNLYTLSELIFAHLYPMMLGFETIEDSALLKMDGVFQYLVGLPSFPNATTLRRFLVRSASAIQLDFHATHNVLRKYFLTLPSTRSSFSLDFDSTAKTLYGNQEGVVKGYNPGHKGEKSYHPLICTETRLRDCLGGSLRHGNAHTAEGVEEMFDEVIELLPHKQGLRIRADAGFYSGKFILKLTDRKIKFTIVAPISQPMKYRLPGLRYQHINDRESTAEFYYKPYRWKEAHRFVVLREKLTEKRKEQLKLLTVDAYAFHVIVTNLALTPFGVFNFYENRAGIERIIRILKDDYPFASAPTKSFIPNSMHAELSLLAYNLIIWFKRLCLPDDWQSYTVETLRQRLFLIPGVFTKTGNRPTLKLPKNSPYRETFEYAQDQIQKLEPLV
ncbi:MAG: IS1380 family transposase [Nitrososphaerales archaeon]